MGHMKNLLITIYGGGDDAVAAACELAGLVKERRAYEDTMRATSDITDIVTVLRSIGFASVPPSAGESASLLHYCVTHAADEIERLRLLSQNSDCPDLDSASKQDILAADERAAVEDMASYFDARGNLTMQAWGSLLHVLLKRIA
jgi:hypothetical protein